MNSRWKEGNHIELLENGDQYFPAVLDAIDEARSKIILETFIWFADSVGWELHRALLNAAQRGIHVEVLIDGYGSPDLSDEFVGTLTDAGVQFRYYDPRRPLLGMRTNVFRRMHRKIVVVDGELAFIGGINFSADHMRNAQPESKQDYALRVTGPVVEDIHHYVLSALAQQPHKRRWWHRQHHQNQDNIPQGEAQALFVWRDNQHHRTDIERHYIKMLASAKREVIIANAYFFPGYRLLSAMRRASRRGVRVKLLVQGQPDMAIVKVGARLLYRFLRESDITIYEYLRCPFHGKVALMDEYWATVGSSNLDPFSLALNLEANLIIYDRAFNQTLRDNLNGIIKRDCRKVDDAMLPARSWWNMAKSVVVFHFLRYFPALISRLPAHKPRLEQVAPTMASAIKPQDGTSDQEVKP
ncbi:cardiolipin synthase B [Salmonella enterica subsp. enterica serovar Choleraesuis]|nr:cardiolipin synthase B [Salmonella enterica subsp. enterica serovar Choleraesuis]